MATFRNRLPKTLDLLYGFTICAFPVHVWAIVIVMQEVPAWILRLSLWDMVGVISYSLALALRESIIIFLGLCLLAFILPPWLLSKKFTASSAILLFVSAIWFIFLHYNDHIIEQRQYIFFAIWAGSWVLVAGGLIALIHKRPKLEKSIRNFAEQLAILSFLYLFFDVVALIIVVIRQF